MRMPPPPTFTRVRELAYTQFGTERGEEDEERERGGEGKKKGEKGVGRGRRMKGEGERWGTRNTDRKESPYCMSS